MLQKNEYILKTQRIKEVSEKINNYSKQVKKPAISKQKHDELISLIVDQKAPMSKGLGHVGID